jgi:predicted lipoprotein
MLDIAKSTTTAECIAASMASDEVMFTWSTLKIARIGYVGAYN